MHIPCFQFSSDERKLAEMAEKSATIMELVSSYDMYTDANEMSISAATDAPATSTPCIYTIVSSAKCAASVGASIGASISFTAEFNC
jgi:hypothetical protein